MLSGLSAYAGSKLAQAKVLEFLAAENPNIFVASVHPGMVDTDMFRKSGSRADAMPMDIGWPHFFHKSPLSSVPPCLFSFQFSIHEEVEWGMLTVSFCSPTSRTFHSLAGQY